MIIVKGLTDRVSAEDMSAVSSTDRVRQSSWSSPSYQVEPVIIDSIVDQICNLSVQSKNLLDYNSCIRKIEY